VLVIGVDATLIEAASPKAEAAGTYTRRQQMPGHRLHIQISRCGSTRPRTSRSSQPDKIDTDPTRPVSGPS
jgi:hypothetical protein